MYNNNNNYYYSIYMFLVNGIRGEGIELIVDGLMHCYALKLCDLSSIYIIYYILFIIIY